MKRQQRPAELTALIVAVIGVAIAFGYEVTPEQSAAIILLVGSLPGVVTFFVARAARS